MRRRTLKSTGLDSVSGISIGPAWRFAGPIAITLVLMILGSGCKPESDSVANSDSSSSSQGPELKSDAGTAAELIRVADGDTFTARLNGREIKVRMHGVDAPELDQEFGRDAKSCLHEILQKEAFRIGTEYEDPYGRNVATVMSLKGVDLNAELVRKGCAWAFRRYSKRYLDDQKQAQDDRAGLWSRSNPQPPWKWRKR